MGDWIRSHWKISLAVVLLLAFSIRLAFGLVIPFNQAFDEHTHYLSVQFMATEGRPPILGKDKDLYEDTRVPTKSINVTYASLPGGAYILPAVFSFLASQCGASPENLYLFARLASILFGLVTIGLAFYLAYKNVGTASALFLALLLSFWPQLIFINATINNDSYTIFATLLCFLFCLRVYRSGQRTPWELLGLSLSAGLVIGGKPTGYPVLLLAAFLFLRHFWKYRQPGDWYKILPLSALVFLAGGGWWLFHNAYHYGLLDPLGNQALYEAWREINLAQNKIMMNPRKRGFSFLEFLFHYTDSLYWTLLFETFLATFGWGGVTLPTYLYTMIKIHLLFLVFLLVLGWIFSPLSLKNFTILISLAIFLITLSLCLYQSWSTHYLPQGKYLLPTLPILLYCGVYLHSRVTHKFCKKLVTYGGISLLVLLLVTSLYSLLLLQDKYNPRKNSSVSRDFLSSSEEPGKRK